MFPPAWGSCFEKEKKYDNYNYATHLKSAILSVYSKVEKISVRSIDIIIYAKTKQLV